MDEILTYLREKYAPLSVILYGSWADGTQDADSDWDALVITADGVQSHDTSVVAGVQLDVFVYPSQCLEGEFDLEQVIQIHEGRLLWDHEGMGDALMRRVQAYVDGLPRKTEEEIRDGIAWCRKMCLRTQREDAEGLFRWHWLLTESLEIYCDASGRHYWGHKKTLAWMQRHFPEDFACYTRALKEFSQESLQDWIACLLKPTDRR